ncbi:MAG: hypothetical protein P8Y75_08140 [Nitrospirota bacterium]|jgi:hypothetical protein
MKILYILKGDPDKTASSLIECHRNGNAVTVVDLRKEGDYGRVVELISENDKVISW